MRLIKLLIAFSLSALSIGLLIGFVVSILISPWVLYSYFEAKSFNKLTGSNITTFEAMFLELRIQDNPLATQEAK